MRLRNIILTILDQGPPIRFIRNLITGRIARVFRLNAHIRHSNGQPKVTYGHKDTALKAVQQMVKKYGKSYTAYKCPRCDGYHIGGNTRNTPN